MYTSTSRKKRKPSRTTFLYHHFGLKVPWSKHFHTNMATYKQNNPPLKYLFFSSHDYSVTLLYCPNFCSLKLCTKERKNNNKQKEKGDQHIGPPNKNSNFPWHYHSRVQLKLKEKQNQHEGFFFVFPKNISYLLDLPTKKKCESIPMYIYVLACFLLLLNNMMLEL